MVWPFDYLFGWTKEEIVEAQNDIASVEMQAARTIQFAWKKYINVKKEAVEMQAARTIQFAWKKYINVKKEAAEMQAARTIQFAWKKYINAKKEAKDEDEKYFFDRRIQSEAAKKKDEEDKNYFDKIISEEEEIVEAQHDIASVDQDEGLAMMLDSDESDEENEAKDQKDETDKTNEKNGKNNGNNSRSTDSFGAKDNNSTNNIVHQPVMNTGQDKLPTATVTSDQDPTAKDTKTRDPKLTENEEKVNLEAKRKRLQGMTEHEDLEVVPVKDMFMECAKDDDKRMKKQIRANIAGMYINFKEFNRFFKEFTLYF